MIAEPPRSTIDVVVGGRLGGDDLEAVGSLVEAAERVDGVSPISEQARLHLQGGGGPGAEANLLLRVAGELVGYAHLDPAGPDGPTDGHLDRAVELVVHPDHRRRGYGRALVKAALRQAPGRLRLWAHGEHPAAQALAASMGMAETRQLWRMHRPLDTPLPQPSFPDGVRVRPFRPGADDEAWLRLNRRAFASHPEQGRWTASDLRQRQAEDWFDPAGFLLAEELHDEATGGPALVASHWTKVHTPDSAAGETGGGRIGEVYVVAVDPDRRGRGLGTAITLAGLHWLRTAGVPEVMLYVEADNDTAVAVYTRLGFDHRGTDVMFSPSRPGHAGETMLG